MAKGLQWQPVIINKKTGEPAPNKAGFTIHWCGKTPGFGLRVTDSGVKTWIVEQRVHGKTVRRKLGRADVISAEQARKDAKKVIGELVQGKDTFDEKRIAARLEKVEGITFADALRQYVDDNSARKDSKPLAERTKEDYLGMIWPGGVKSSERRGVRSSKPGELASIADMRVDKLVNGLIKALYVQLQKRGRTRAAYAMRVVRAVLRYHGVKLPDNPFDSNAGGRDRIRLPAANARDRVIKPDELRAWWKAAAGTPDGDKFQFMLLSGVRPGETNAIKVADVDLTGGGRVAIADPSRPYDVLLSKEARRIVAERVKKGKGAQDALFDADARKSQAAIIEQSGVVFSPHDLRRSFETVAGSRLPGYLAKKLVNHAMSGDVTAAHYFRADDATLRAGWQTVTDFIMAKVAQRPSRRARRRTS
jgi:integrase